MFDIKYNIQRAAVIQMISSLRKDPEKNIGKVFQIIRGFDSNNNFPGLLDELEKNITNNNSNLNKLVIKLSKTVNENIFKTFFLNLVMNSCIKGSGIMKKNINNSNNQIRPIIPLEPYSKNEDLVPSIQILNEKIQNGKSMGIYSYIFCGDEPLLSKNNIISLCKMNNDCIFTILTPEIKQIDNKFCEDICNLGNVIPIIQFKTENKRVNLTCQYWQNVIKTMNLLKSHGILFGFYTLFTSYNCDFLLSDNFIDSMINSGAYFSLYSSKAYKNQSYDSTMYPNSKQKEDLKNKIIAWRQEKVIFNIDIENDSRLLLEFFQMNGTIYVG